MWEPSQWLCIVDSTKTTGVDEWSESLMHLPPTGTRHSTVLRWPCRAQTCLTQKSFSQSRVWYSTTPCRLGLHANICKLINNVHGTQLQKHLHSLIGSNGTSENRVLLYHEAPTTLFWHVVNMKFTSDLLNYVRLCRFSRLCSFWCSINIFGGRDSQTGWTHREKHLCG